MTTTNPPVAAGLQADRAAVGLDQLTDNHETEPRATSAVGSGIWLTSDSRFSSRSLSAANGVRS